MSNPKKNDSEPAAGAGSGSALAEPSQPAAAPRAAPTMGVEPSADRTRDLRLQTARREISERRRITQRLRHALAHGGLVLHYQRQVNLASGALRGAEAMIRLEHRRRGLILPNRFMPVAEHSDVIHDIGGWALLHACLAAASWPAPVLVALTLSARQLQSTRLIKHLIEALARSGLAAERLELELTEAMLLDNSDDIFFSLRALAGLGVRVAVNDFGVGYASLSVLRRLPLTTLKLDRTLIHGLGREDSNAAIIHAAIEAGHALGFTVLADGVETAEQCETLRQMGCDDGQGAHFGAPGPAEGLVLGAPL
jgi:EAL domain-containing protein (putative c-di-GMP-specific phosphodiesterase class I)